MKITMLTAGSLGDVQPYVALGLGMQSAGHQVRVTSFSPFRELVTSHGLEFVSITNPADGMDGDRDWDDWMNSGNDPTNFVRYFIRVVQNVRATLEQMLDDMWQACVDVDAIISSSSGLGTPEIFETLNKPGCWALFSPMTRTSEFPFLLTPAGLRLGSRGNRMTYILADYTFWQIARPLINPWRRNHLKLRQLPSFGPFGLFRQRLDPVFYGFSPAVIPKPDDWDAQQHVTGYWFLDRSSEWNPPVELVDFLAGGPPPIYFGLAGINGVEPQVLVDMVVHALGRARQRGIVYMPGVSQPETTDRVLMISSTPHDWLFPQMAAVVHHGGAGTTGATFRAGVPSLGIPSFFDQPFWSQRIADLGVGAKPIPPNRLSIERLTAALAFLTTNETVKARAAALGNRIRGEKGVEEAVSRIQHHLEMAWG